ncbi:hypothetical protein NIES2101_05050 [Calothrix sp. HK-06]|nr:hypothetical protein NIES2101_05050 [Calothrix sp. HK-06]
MQQRFMPAKKMHGYVFGLLGVFLLFAISLPVACFRVKENKKFAKYDSHIRSLTMEYKPVKYQAK